MPLGSAGQVNRFGEARWTQAHVGWPIREMHNTCGGPFSGERRILLSAGHVLAGGKPCRILRLTC